MSKTIVQKILFKNTSPGTLYELYVDSKKHAIATGAPARIAAKEGGNFSAHNNWIKGKILQLIKNKLIVQSWRGADWLKETVDSTFVLFLEQKGKHTVVYATHANVPDSNYDAINKGWHQHYWEPWKKYLAGTPVAESVKM